MGKETSMYRIREVDAFDEDVADALVSLHRRTFLDRGLPVSMVFRLRLPGSCPRRPRQTADISPESAS
jgi:hypothetical protein